MSQENVSADVSSLSRIVAISYRDKECLREGVVIEQRPTMVLIIDGEKNQEIMLSDEDHEMCFMRREKRILPPAKAGGKDREIDYTDEGLKKSDIVLMVMGGSGAFFAFALSNQLEKLGAGKVLWIGSTLFKRLCDTHQIERSKLKSVDDDGKRTELTFDHTALAALYKIAPEQFQEVSVRERDLILLQDVVSRRKEAMLARMACAARVRQRMKKLAYCTHDAYPEGGVKVFIEEGVANDAMLNLFIEEEKQIEAELKKLLHSLAVWKVFKPIKQVGELTAAPLIVAIGDIHRFPSDSHLKAFLGVHTLKNDGTKFRRALPGEPKEVPAVGNSKFARRRQGQLSNWNQVGRQSLYLIANQFMVYGQKSPWGLVAQEVKKRFLEKHPNPQVWVRGWVLDGDTSGSYFSHQEVCKKVQSINASDVKNPKAKMEVISNFEIHIKRKDGETLVFREGIVEKVDLVDGMCKRVQGGWIVTEEDGTKNTVIGVTKYNPAHINRMTAWRTMTKFVEWLYSAWKATEAGKVLPALPYLKKEEELIGAVGTQKAA